VVLFLAIFLFLSPVDAAVFTYPGNTTGMSIQDVIDNATSGDTILLQPGNYYDNPVIRNPVVLRAYDPDNPPVLITGTGEAGVTITANGAGIDGMVISGNASHGLLLHSDNNKIYNVTVTGFPSGISLVTAVHNELAWNRLTGNVVGIEMDHDSQANTVYLNYFDNRADVVVRTNDVEWSSAPWEYRYLERNFTGSLGNYWKAYTGTDSNGDGIGDQQYRVQQDLGSGSDTLNLTAVTDRAPLVADPSAYILVQRRLPGTNPLGAQLPSGLPGFQPEGNSPFTSGQVSAGGPPGPFPGVLIQYWWIIPVLLVVSAAGGIMFERSRRKKAHAGSVDEFHEVLLRNATVVKRPPPDRETDTGGMHHYAAHLPPALAKKYPHAEYLAEGGASRVFRAYDPVECRDIAVKVPIRFDEVTGTQFTKELQVWQGLHHKNIVEIYAANIFPVPYIEMEYVESSLASVKFPLETDRAVEIVRGVAEGLQYAHQQGIVHRDIKPGNILIAPDGTPKISDWGLAKAEGTKQSGIIGFSLEYASPEQLAPNLYGEPGAWTDIYQLGVLFYEMLTGQVPFKGGGMGEVTQAILHDDPPLPNVSGPDSKTIQKIILRCMKKSPKNRYHSVAEILAELDTLKR
jgi:hypothetical protein